MRRTLATDAPRIKALRNMDLVKYLTINFRELMYDDLGQMNFNMEADFEQ
jgi:hypothetical protein